MLFKLDIGITEKTETTSAWVLLPSAQDSDRVGMAIVEASSFLKSLGVSDVQLGCRTTDNERYVTDTEL